MRRTYLRYLTVLWMIGKFRKVASHFAPEAAYRPFLNLQGSAAPFEPTARVSLSTHWSTQIVLMELQNVHRKFFHPINPSVRAVSPAPHQKVSHLLDYRERKLRKTKEDKTSLAKGMWFVSQDEGRVAICEREIKALQSE